jgi:signal transduction histidine kinase
VVLLTLAALASVFVVRQALLVRLDDQVEQNLAQEVEEFERLVDRGIDPETGRPFGTDVKAIFETFLERNVPGEGEELITVPRQGQIRYQRSERVSTLLTEETDLAVNWRRLESVQRGDVDTPSGPARYIAVPVDLAGRPRGAFVVANFTAGERAEIDETVSIVAAVSGGVLLLGTVLAFFAAGRVLEPLRELRDAARSVSGTDMTRRIQLSGEDEIAELGRTFNRMLDRLEYAFSSQREFIRDASHELRTPITIIRGHLELLGEAGSHDDLDRDGTLELVTDELDRISRFVEDLLLLARADRPDFLHAETVRLDEFLDELVGKARSLGERDWRLEGTSPGVIVADRQRLTQAIMSLAENAVQHTDIGDEIALGCSMDGSRARVWVRDTGPGIPPEEQELIFKRFQRGRTSRARYEGSGLGLAIVRAIAEAHGGQVKLLSRPGAGSRFEVVVPVDQQPLAPDAPPISELVR